MSVGTISSFDSLKTTHSTTGVAHKPSALTGGQDVTVDCGNTVTTKYAYGASGADTVNQVTEYIFTATHNTTTSLVLSAPSNNMVGDVAATYTVVKILEFHYLTVAQDATNGTLATGTVTIEHGGTHGLLTTPIGATGTYVMSPGDKWFIEEHNATGIAIVANTTDQLDFVNADASIDAHFLIKIYGNK